MDSESPTASVAASQEMGYFHSSMTSRPVGTHSVAAPHLPLLWPSHSRHESLPALDVTQFSGLPAGSDHHFRVA